MNKINPIPKPELGPRKDSEGIQELPHKDPWGFNFNWESKY